MVRYNTNYCAEGFTQLYFHLMCNCAFYALALSILFFLQSVKIAVDKQLSDLSQTNPAYRVALITFNDEVRIFVYDCVYVQSYVKYNLNSKKEDSDAHTSFQSTYFNQWGVVGVARTQCTKNGLYIMTQYI